MSNLKAFWYHLQKVKKKTHGKCSSKTENNWMTVKSTVSSVIVTLQYKHS